MNKKHLYLTKGVHIVFPHHLFPLKYAVYFDVPDGRMIFAIPRGRTTYVGTTDTHYTGDKNHVRTLQEDVDYLLEGIHNTFSSLDLQRDDVISSWAGLRPLIYEEGKSASEISRKDEIFESNSGLLSIAGGKLTGYRKMSQKIVDLIGQKIRQKHSRLIGKCITDRINLCGGPFEDRKAIVSYVGSLEKKVEGLDLDMYAAQYLVRNYGRQSEQILEIFAELEDADPRIRLSRAELHFCIRHELAQTPMDFLARRSGRLYFEIDTIPRLIDPILEDFRQFFGWTDETLQLHRAKIMQSLEEASKFD